MLESDRAKAEVPFLHVVVLAAPTEELAGEPVHPPELRRSEQRHPAERTAVRKPGKTQNHTLHKTEFTYITDMYHCRYGIELNFTGQYWRHAPLTCTGGIVDRLPRVSVS